MGGNLLMRLTIMIKHITNVCLFLIPLTITYAIISDLGKPGNHYGSPSDAGMSYQSVSQSNGN
jgi:hypothetical protein